MQRTSFNRVPWRLLFGVALAIVGSAWAILALRGPQFTRRSGTAPGASTVPANLILPVPKNLPQASRDQADVLQASVEKQAQAAMLTAEFSTLSSANRDSAAKEIAQTASNILAPDFERYLQFCRDRGEEKPFILTLPEAQRESSFRTQCTSFAGQPVREGTPVCRWRVRAGQEIPVKDIEPISMTPKRAMGFIASSSAADPVDAIEYVFPTFAKTPAGEAISCRLGIWVGKTRSSPQWKMLRLMIYDVPPAGKTVVPPPM